MRVGINPHRNKQIGKTKYTHQVVMPVYIPNNLEYYKDSFTIFKLSIKSLLKTISTNTFVTIVNNGSSSEVKDYINKLYDDKLIHEVINTKKIGKINSVIKGVKGYNFSLITITDADVLFLENWQEETYKIFENYKKVGSVSTTPSSKALTYNTFNIYFDLFFSKKLKFTNVVNKKAMLAFARSTGNKNLYSKTHLEKILTVKEKNNLAVVGGGHYVATYRSDILYNSKSNSVNYFLGGNSVQEYLDNPVVKKGYWRLSTLDNYTYHMGNTYEEWMKETFESILNNNNKFSKIKLRKEINELFIVYFLKNVIFKKLLLRKVIKKYFFKSKGLTNQEFYDYQQ